MMSKVHLLYETTDGLDYLIDVFASLKGAQDVAQDHCNELVNAHPLLWAVNDQEAEARYDNDDAIRWHIQIKDLKP
jgi:hypothetical protein